MVTQRTQPKDTPLMAWLKETLKERGILPYKLAMNVGVSHATMSRWLHGKDVPNTKTCQKIADFTGDPLPKILALAGHMPKYLPSSDRLPPFRVYMELKYPRISRDFVNAIARGVDRA